MWQEIVLKRAVPIVNEIRLHQLPRQLFLSKCVVFTIIKHDGADTALEANQMEYQR
jgi:hypothetical protein